MIVTDGMHVGDHAGPVDLDGGELLYGSDRTRISRVLLPGGDTAIRKEPIGPAAAQRLRHELAILNRLDGVEGVPQLAAGPTPAGAITFVDAGGTALAGALPMDPARVLPFALDLTRVVAAVHQRAVVHKDINPANIIVCGEPARPTLIDFDLATTNATDRPGFSHENEIAGTLAYLAPEQTGRTGRPVDQRADLYALGATLYEVVTGRPPFGTGDPLRLTHDHLARVPVPPAELNPAAPPGLSEVILRLLEKEPDQRYQSADGLTYDLAQLQLLGHAPARLGERDFPPRLSPPSRLIGRDAQIATLRDAFAAANAGAARGVLVSGAPGVGKTALTDELRSVAAAAGGWFVTGKFDQYRQDRDSDAVRQAFRALGRLLLAESADELDRLRPRILRTVGTNASLVAAVLPEFALLLDVVPEVGEIDPGQAESRLAQAALDLIRVIGSPQRPVVMVIDNLQWAGSTPIGFFDAVLSEPDLAGVLLVGAYREAEVDAAHPLAATLGRWHRLGVAPTELRLANLAADDLGTLLAEMMRLAPDEAARLADVVGARTGGNPYDTVELINALRRDGALATGPDGWCWDADTLRRYLGSGDVVDLLVARIEALPAPTRSVLETMGCLAGQVRTDLLEAATGLEGRTLEDHLDPALEDGLLVLERGGEGSVRFPHDRVQQAAYARLRPEARQALHLDLARRLAGRPGFAVVAAEQYLPAIEAVTDPAERRRAVELFRGGAKHARLLTNHAVGDRFLTAAILLLGSAADDLATRVELEIERHLARYSLGRLDEADDSYRFVADHCTDPLRLAAAARTQVSSLTNRARPRDAVALGCAVLRELGHPVPEADELGPAIGAELAALYDWLATDDGADDPSQPEITTPRVLAIAKLVNRMLTPAYFSDQAVMAWLVLEAGRLWAEHGPMATLVGPLSHAAFIIAALREDYRTGERAVRRVLAVSEARGYEPDASQARFLYALGTAAWFGPLEESIRQAHLAREGLVRGGDLQNACYSYFASLPQSFDCLPTLDACAAEAESAVNFATRTGNDHAGPAYLAYRRLVRALRAADEPPEPVELAGNPTAAALAHITSAQLAAIFGNQADLVTHASAGFALLDAIQNTYPTLNGHLFQALAAAGQVRAAAAAAPPGGAGALAAALATVDACLEWLDARAADAPGNYRHLVRLVEGERAWAVDDFRTAAVAFDAAQREVATRERPWHRALIAERAAQFHLAYGLEHAGRTLLAEARRGYETWGATAKVRDLDDRYPFLRTAPAAGVDGGRRSADPGRTSTLSADTIDLLGILDAARALSSETNLHRLRARVVDVLRAVTGATAVTMVLWDADRQGWFLPAQTGDDDSSPPIAVAQAGADGLLPLSAFRYAERTREPLLVEDATRDDRFAREPYFANLDSCSLLVVPILTRGMAQAMVLMENRLSRGTFSADRLDAVLLIAGQLAVSLDNALVYASLERKVAERTEALAVANQRLETLSVTDPLTGLANRRRLSDVLEAEWQRAVRPGTPIAIAMIDIDHFKRYNDHYGHPAGDECLRRVARILTQHVRGAVDLVARYGGEEFALVLPGADAAVAFQIAERARAAIEALNDAHPLAERGYVTVSIGVAAAAAREPGTPQQLMAAADARLYEAKRAGRNQVTGGPTG